MSLTFMDIKYNAIYSPREGTGPASTNNLNGGDPKPFWLVLARTVKRPGPVTHRQFLHLTTKPTAGCSRLHRLVQQ